MYSVKRLIFNAATFVPGVTGLALVKRKLTERALGTGGTNQARYCYTVWLRHLVMAHASGLDTAPARVAELGPGDSLGIGLAAILTGVERYYAFDVVAHASVQRNLAVLADLIDLFSARAEIPDACEYPRVGPTLENHAFPWHILTEERLAHSLRPERLERIRAALEDCTAPHSMVQYRAPWHTDAAIEADTLDVVFSQAVLEHVDQLEQTYAAMYRWLKPGGYMSHQIDFKSHDSAREWNGHWTYSELRWKIARGKDTWLINREPHSVHMELMRRCGFEILAEQTVRQPSRIAHRHLAKRFRNLTDEDLTTSDAFVQAVKPGTILS